MKSSFKKTGTRQEITYPRPRIKGLGDAVALVAQPIAKAIDAMAGTQIATCGGCQKRREMLNQKIPFT
jgi:hypothetical protein